MILARTVALKSLRFGNHPLRKANHLVKNYSSEINILGIETSCDDTGCAIINGDGLLLGESLHSQNLIHLRNGGIIPDIAQNLHQTYIESTVNETLENAGMSMESISAIAVTLRPGIELSLAVGMKYAKHLSRRYKKPIIPIHHMQAHALVARMNHNINFPFLVLLISGGHCLLAIVQDVNKFKLLGQSLNIAPGDMFDKVARRIKLRNLPEYSKLNGGRAIEIAASKSTNPNTFQLPLPLAEFRNCNFSFNGLKTFILYQHLKKEKEHNIVADELIPEVNDLCAALLMATTRHLVHRVQRAIEFCEQNELIPNDNRVLVVSGGVACNDYIFNVLKLMCNELDYKIFRPSPRLCTDNGVMIAWNGLEKWRKGIDIVRDINKLDVEAISPIGEDLTLDVAKASIMTKLMKIKL